MTTEKLKEILEKHVLWLNNDVKGERADLRYANLRGANLRYANLRGADLSYANLSYANLRGANLRGANLRGADLSSADLSNADLSSADLSNADLDFASFKFSCSFTNLKMSEAGVGQLLFHALNIAEFSGIDVKKIEDIYALIKQSTPITKHGLTLKALSWRRNEKI